MAKISSANTAPLLGRLQANDKSMGKQLLKLATGQKLNSAGDDTSGYTISERMRVRLRALDKAKENTATGWNMIDTASQAVQSQLDLMRTIKEKVIDANNDSNTDADRQTIQKEITHCLQEISDIAYETTYNGKLLLCGGDHIKDTVFAWEVLDEAVKVEGSDALNIIPDNYDVLDNLEGAFDVFSLWKTNTSTDGGKNGLVTAAPWEVQTESLTNSSKAVYTATFNYSSLSDLDDKGVYVRGYNDSGGSDYRYFVFSNETTDNYRSGSKIDIRSAGSVDGAVSLLASAINSSLSSYVTASASGKTLTLTAKASTAWGNSNYVSGFSAAGDTTTGVNRTAASATGASFGRFSGGTDSSGIVGDHDAPYVAATPATATVTGLSSAAAGTGFTMTIRGYSTVYFRIADDSSGINYNSSDQTWTIGKNSSFSRSIGGATLSYSGGTLTVTTNGTGTYYNSSSFSDGFSASTASTSSGYTAVTAANLSTSSTAATIDPSKYILDVSAYKGNTDSADLETFIQSLAGITNNYFTLASSSSGSYYGPYEFIDTGSTESVAALTKVANGTNSTKIDLNNMRNLVDSGKDIAEAFARTVQTAANTNNTYINTTLYTDSEGDTVGVSFNNAYFADPNASAYAALFKDYDATLGHYELDFSGVNTGNIAQLDDKGFRFYCATDALQWYNFLFDDGKEDLPDRPASGTDTLDINTATIDISRITDTASLVQAVYEDGDAMMAELDHYYRMSKVAGDDTKLYVYDPRRFDISTAAAYRGRYNERGAKIADGVFDNVIKSRRDIMQKKIIIQDTDKADFHTRLYIDQTTLDHLFEYKIGSDDIFNYTVTKLADREKFLGNDETGDKGMLDNAIQKLLEAQTLLGAQASRLEATSANLTTTTENEQSSESVIRDADMAKESVEFAKFNILTQSSQAMLGQANQSSSSVLSLLQ